MNANTYFYGRPDSQGSCEQVLSIFAAHESLNSERTSSLPLAQFWNDTRRSDFRRRLKTIGETTGITIPEDGCKLCFEYSVPVRFGKGKSSMTDLMIISDDLAIAIEAKYTEAREGYESIGKWLGRIDRGETSDNKPAVLKGWLSYIQKAGCTSAEGIEELDRKAIPYQLLHRIASACATAMESEGKPRRPVVIYQMFYDRDSDEKGTKDCVTSGDVRRFVSDKILPGIEKLGLKRNSIDLAVIMTCVTPPPRDELPDRKEDYGDLFVRMAKARGNQVYQIHGTECLYRL